MKRTGILLLIVLLLCLCACDQRTGSDPQIVFYYPSTELQAQTENAGLIPYPMPDVSVQDIGLLINQYMSNSETAQLHSPFAKNVKLLQWDKADEVLELVFSDSLSQMSSHEITLSCAALSATLFQLEQFGQINFRCEHAQLNGNQTLSFTPTGISWLDTISTDIIIETEATK